MNRIFLSIRQYHQARSEFLKEAILLQCKTTFSQGMNGAQKQTSAAKSQIL